MVFSVKQLLSKLINFLGLFLYSMAFGNAFEGFSPPLSNGVKEQPNFYVLSTLTSIYISRIPEI